MSEREGPGRPPLYETPEELEVLIEEYFSSCEEEMWRKEEDEEGNITWKPVLDRQGNIKKMVTRPMTLSGLAVALGVDRKTILNYSKKDAFFHTIKRARAKIENYAEEQLFDKTSKNVAGIIFNLKNNHDWQEKTEVKHEGAMPIQIVDDIGADDAG